MSQTNFVRGQVVQEVAEYLWEAEVHYDDVCASYDIHNALEDILAGFFEKAIDILFWLRQHEDSEKQARIDLWRDILAVEDQTPLF